VAEDQVALPVAGHRAVIGLGGTLADVDHVGDLIAALVGAPAGASERPPGAQALGQIAAQRAAGLDIERLIDRLGRHPHLSDRQELAAQAADDLLGRVAPSEIFLHLAAQPLVDRELGRLGPARAHIRPRV
jgi:hypothetical protein